MVYGRKGTAFRCIIFVFMDQGGEIEARDLEKEDECE